MKFREAWRYSKIVAIESMLKGQVLMYGGQSSMQAQRDPAKFVRRAKSSLRINKLALAVVFGAFSIFEPVLFLGPHSSTALKFVTTSLYLAFGLVFLISFNLLNITSLTTGEALKPIAELPFSRQDLSRISVLSFFRMLDIPLIVFVVGYPVTYGIITGSLIGAIMILLLNVVNGMLGVFLTFFLARGFYKRILSVGGSRIKSFFRTLLSLLYGLITIGMVYLVSYAFQFANQLVAFFSIVEGSGHTWITLIYPFSFSYLALLLNSVLAMPDPQLSLMSSQSVFAIAASAFYIFLAYIGYKRGMGALRQLALGEIEMAPKMGKVGEIRLHVGGVYSSVVRKDLKLASRNAAYSGFLVMPIIGVIIFTSIAFGYSTLRVALVLSALSYSSFFMVLFALSTMWFEGRGVSVLAQLPISTRRVVQAKSLMSGALSLMIPAALAVVSFFKPFTTPFSLFIALSEVAAIYAAALLATVLVCSLFGEGRLPSASIEGHALKYGFVMILSSIFVYAPMAVYGLAYLFLGLDHFLATMTMAVAVAMEVILANAIARGALKD